MTTQVGIVGAPVAHSLSPKMQNAAFAELGLDWNYSAHRVEPQHFESDVKKLIEKGYVGLNVTIPHKLAAFNFADSCSEAAAAIGAVNTLKFSGDGSYGENTDALGLIDALVDQKVKLAGASALVLGAGGTARAALWALLQLGVKEIFIYNRTRSRAEELVKHFERLAPSCHFEVVSTPAKTKAKPNLLINATSIGLSSSDQHAELTALKIAPGLVERTDAVIDFVYRQEGQTELISLASDLGVAMIDGLELLVQQGAKSFEIWTGREAPVAVMRASLERS